MDVRQFFAQTNRYTAAVRKLLSVKGEGHDVTYGIHIEDERPEHSFLKNEKLWVQLNQVTSAAGTLALIGVGNPVGSQILTVVTNCFAWVSADAQIQLTWFSVLTHALTASMWCRDGRFGIGSLQATTSRMTTATPVGVGGTANFAILPCIANQVMDVMVNVGRVPPIILAPGQEVVVAVTAVGVNTLTATFAGYERSLESGELIPG